MLVEEITSKEFEEALKTVKAVIIPVGSVEAHGPHLPIATDLYTIYEVCKALSKEVDVLVAPPVYYGLCRSTRRLPGTVSIRGEVLKALLLDIFSEFWDFGIKNFFVLSGHAGGTHNAFILDAVENFLENHKDANFFVANIYELLKPALEELEIPFNDSHAGEWEASLIMYFKPELVKGKGYEDYPKFPKFWVTSDKKKYWPSGIWGNPLKATPEKGKILAKRLIDILKAELKKLEK